jgi:hypothetical protein
MFLTGTQKNTKGAKMSKSKELPETICGVSTKTYSDAEERFGTTDGLLVGMALGMEALHRQLKTVLEKLDQLID